MVGSGYEALCTAAEMRVAEEAFPGFPVTALVRTGKFRPETLEDSSLVPEIVLSSVAQLPDWLERSL